MAKEKRTCRNQDCGKEFDVDLDDPRARRFRFCSPQCRDAAGEDKSDDRSDGEKKGPKGQRQPNNRCAHPDCTNSRKPNSHLCMVHEPVIKLWVEKTTVTGGSYDVIITISYNGQSVSGELEWAIDGEGSWTKMRISASGDHLVIQPSAKVRTLLVRLVSLVLFDHENKPYDESWTIDTVRYVLPPSLPASTPPVTNPPQIELGERHDAGAHWEIPITTRDGAGKPKGYAFEVLVPGKPATRTDPAGQPFTTNSNGCGTISLPFSRHRHKVTIRLVDQGVDETISLPGRMVPYSDANPCPLEGERTTIQLPEWIKRLLQWLFG